MRYGEDVPRRVEKVENLHAQEVMLRGAIIEEFRAVFNLASLFADALFTVVPDHPYIAIARFEGLLGRFDIKEINEIPIEVESPSVPPMHEGRVLPVPSPQWHTDTGAGHVHDAEASGFGDSVAQRSGSSDAQADGDGGSPDSDRGSEQVPISWGSGEELADGSVPSLGKVGE